MALTPSEFDQSTEFVRPMTSSRRTSIKDATESNPFIAPSDGYVSLKANANGPVVLTMGSSYFSLGAPTNTWNLSFVKKNTDMFLASYAILNCEYAFFCALS